MTLSKKAKRKLENCKTINELMCYAIEQSKFGKYLEGKQVCILCNKQTNEVNASNQPTHKVCMENYSKNVKALMNNTKGLCGQCGVKLNGNEVFLGLGTCNKCQVGNF